MDGRNILHVLMEELMNNTREVTMRYHVNLLRIILKDWKKSKTALPLCSNTYFEAINQFLQRGRVFITSGNKKVNGSS